MTSRTSLVLLAVAVVVAALVGIVVLTGDDDPGDAAAPRADGSSSSTPGTPAAETTEPRTTVATLPMTDELEAFCRALFDYQALATSTPTTLEDLRRLAVEGRRAVDAMAASAPEDLADDLAAFAAHAAEYQATVDAAPSFPEAAAAGEATVSAADEAAATRVGEWGATQCVRG